MAAIRGAIELPAHREPIELRTDDGLVLVGELALPERRPPVATLICLHPLPTAGGSMDSHIVRKAAARLPALADLAVLRFNFRGTASPRGTSQGEFGEGVEEQHDLEAAMRYVVDRGLPAPWLLGWSFGTDVALKHARAQAAVEGLILLSPPLRRVGRAELKGWVGDHRRIVALIPEFDEFLPPAEAEHRFASLSQVELIPVEGGKHLWVGESQTRRVLNEIVAAVNPAALPLPTEFSEPPASG